MIVELISVGTEILMGNIVNTNAAYLAEKCAGLGLTMYHQVTVGDNPERLRDTVNLAVSRSDIIILTGGLGPTADDLTKETVAEAFGRKLVRSEAWEQSICRYFEKRGVLEITENNWKQADVIEGAKLLDNPNGTACGEIITDSNGKTAILLPGPPGEMIPMFLQSVDPYLKKRSGRVLVSRMVKVSGIGESSAETKILDLIGGQSNPTIAPYAKTGEVHFRVTAAAEKEEEANQLLQPVIEELSRRFGDLIYTVKEEVTLESCLLSMCKERQMKLVTAESLTGGAIASRLINVPGASEVIKESFITYSNEAKENRLGVKHGTIVQYGAVSEETAREMAEGALRVSGADLAVSVTGIAGPSGGSAEKPVGLVYIACSVRGITSVRKFQFSGNRAKVRENTVAAALHFTRHCLLGQDAGQAAPEL